MIWIIKRRHLYLVGGRNWSKRQTEAWKMDRGVAKAFASGYPGARVVRLKPKAK